MKHLLLFSCLLLFADSANGQTSKPNNLSKEQIEQNIADRAACRAKESSMNKKKQQEIENNAASNSIDEDAIKRLEIKSKSESNTSFKGAMFDEHSKAKERLLFITNNNGELSSVGSMQSQCIGKISNAMCELFVYYNQNTSNPIKVDEFLNKLETTTLNYDFWVSFSNSYKGNQPIYLVELINGMQTKK